MGFFSDRRASKAFAASPAAERQIVFYAESASDWPHFSAVVNELTGPMGLTISYLTSDNDDPILNTDNPNIKPYCIGAGTIRTILFQSIDAQVMVMTLTDLESFNLKRSIHPVHYVYIFHSINSTHMVYRERAFDAYDTVFCVGPHHEDEIRKTEAAYDLKPKDLVQHGYGRLDAIVQKSASLPPFESSEGNEKKILLAPSWGTGSFIENAHGDTIIESLLEQGHHLTLRLHPMTVRHHPKLGDNYQKKYGDTQTGSFQYETNMNSQESLQRSDLMISDWSGASFEYAFGLKRPVLYVDTEPKINNPQWQKTDAEPVESVLRTEIGDILHLDALDDAPAKVVQLCNNPAAFAERIERAQKRCIFNLGSSGKVAAQAILKIADHLKNKE